MDIVVSVVTPTYNRRIFIPILIQIYQNQSYPKEKMEWIILDDGRDKVKDLFEEAAKTIPNIRYIACDDKMRIGAKRNRLNREARGQIIVSMDDDDYYPADRVQTVVQAFRKNPDIDLAGSSEIYMFYLDTKQIYVSGPFHKNHAINCTMAWRKRYSDKHFYDEYITKTEETSFLENYSHPMIQLDPKKTILMICHSDNTVDKKDMRTRTASYMMKLTSYKIEDFVREHSLLSFYHLKHTTYQ